MSPRRLLLPSLSLALLAACGDDGTGNAPVEGPDFDLVFAGEVGGTPVLMRTEGAARTVRRVGIGIPGIGAVASPDGQRLLFTTMGSSAEPPSLALLTDPEGEPVMLPGATDATEREPKFSPDGARLAFTSLRDDPYGDVFVADAPSTAILQLRNLTGANGGDGTADMTPSWSPDGTRIAWTSYRAGNPMIWIMNADGTGARALTESGQWGDYFPTWSPAGDSIAFQRLTGISQARIGLVAASGGTPRFLALPGDAYSPAWAPDAPRLAITMRLASGDLDIHVVGTDGTIHEHVRRAGHDYQPAWLRRSARF